MSYNCLELATFISIILDEYSFQIYMWVCLKIGTPITWSWCCPLKSPYLGFGYPCLGSPFCQSSVKDTAFENGENHKSVVFLLAQRLIWTWKPCSHFVTYDWNGNWISETPNQRSDDQKSCQRAAAFPSSTFGSTWSLYNIRLNMRVQIYTNRH